MGAHETRSEYGPSWGDVQTFLEALAETYGGRAYVETTIYKLTKWGDRQGLWVRVVWQEKPNGSPGAERAAAGGWPNTGHRTMPALIYKLCHLLERALEDLAHDNAMGLGWDPQGGLADQVDRPGPLPPKKGA